MKQRQIVCLSIAAIVLAAGTQSVLADSADLPPVQHDGAISYVSGGIGLSESTAMKEARNDYPLALEFVGMSSSGNDYLADIPVQISNAKGETVLKTQAHGPFMLVSLPSGKYTVTGEYKGQTKHYVVNIASSSHVRQMFAWPMQ